MCAIAGILQLNETPIKNLDKKLNLMNKLQSHRGPDGEGVWESSFKNVGFAHRRLSIIDILGGTQPMELESGNCIIFNGEIYNYIELRDEIGISLFKTNSDTEVILRAYEKWGESCVDHLRGMFAFAIWDRHKNKLFCARDRFGIKPFYYSQIGDTFYFSSEIKALLPFLPEIETDSNGLADYLTFQYCLEGKTMFKHVKQLLPAHTLTISNGKIKTSRYWQVYYDIDYNHTQKYFTEKLREILFDSVKYHIRSDVPIGGYISGGFDSSIISSLASEFCDDPYIGFVGKFTDYAGFDESQYARSLAEMCNFSLYDLDITVYDFINNIEKIIYHLDEPTAGPGSFPQYMISSFASKFRKVVLGGQGGDELFGGYARYLVAYFEQCIKAAIDGTSKNGNFVVTYESIIPNLITLQSYKPMLKDFWSSGLFDDADKRYFKLIDRATQLGDEINRDEFDDYSPYESFRSLYMGNNIKNESYFDRMTHYDLKASLPALLQVEDRVSMAHGLESRVPLLDHKIVELAATMPADIKFKNGTLKNAFKEAFSDKLPDKILKRTDKMGFPVPLNKWIQNEAKDFIVDIFTSKNAKTRRYVDNSKILNKIGVETDFGRNIWGYLCIELWHRNFHDKLAEYKKMASFS